MDIKEIKSIAFKMIKAHTFYDNLKTIKNDIEFFRMYMERERKGPFLFDVRVSSYGGKLFNRVWQSYGFGIEYIEDVYSIYEAFKAMVTDVYMETNLFSVSEKKSFFNFFEKEMGLNAKDYVGSFIDCSMGTTETVKKIEKIIS